MVVKGGLKLSILGGAIYATQKADSMQTTENIKAYITTNPTVKYYCALTELTSLRGAERCPSFLPCPAGVKATFKHLLNMPEYSKQAASWCMNAMSGMIEEPKTPPADTKKPSK
nr:uncharacterized protein LOC119176548 [Rhipicephalus microplus]XP_037291958.1 uncharacterized protein LOC119188147 [Rhipicephalus microplus]